MSDVNVTREHRLASLRATGWSLAAGSDPAISRWLDVGGDTITRSNKFVGEWVTNMVEENAVALAIATAEHNLRATVIADLRALLASAQTDDGGDPWQPGLERVDADSIRNLIETLEAQQS